MELTRRGMLKGTGALAGLALASRAGLADARGLLTDPLLEEVIGRALSAAKKAGATYADVRIVRRRSESIFTRDDHISNVEGNESYGLGVRVIAAGAWGFSAASQVVPAAAERAAQLAVEIAKANAPLLQRPVQLAPVKAMVDTWQTPLERNPFKIPLAEKSDLLLAINGALLKVPGVKHCFSWFQGLGEWKLFASSEGAHIEQDLIRIRPGYNATAIDAASGEFETRDHDIAPAQAGWEYVAQSTLLQDAPRIGEEAVQKLKSPSVAPGKKHLILAPSNMWLTIHESVGHPTELDRAMGYEANFAGTSFLTVDKLNKFQFAAPALSFYADKTTPTGLATCGYDDDGVKTQKWDIVRNGKFVSYQTTREQAGWINEDQSRGCSYAQDFRSFPFQRMPNVSLEPGSKDLGLKDLIAATDDGILIHGEGSYSIDHQRYNFQFGGQMFYEVKKGKVTRSLRDVAYQSSTPDFWKSCDMLGGPREWAMNGSFWDGKGEPGQVNAVSHGCPPARFAQVNILNTSRRKGQG
jgi:TldD protein